MLLVQFQSERYPWKAEIQAVNLVPSSKFSVDHWGYSEKNPFFPSVSQWDMAIFRAKISSKQPKMVLVVPLTRYFDAINCFHRCTGPMSPKILKKVEKFAKIWFFSQFSGLDMAIFRAKICSTWPEMVLVVPPARYCDALICFHRCTGPLTTKKMEESWKNCKKSIFQAKFAGIGALERC